MLGTQLQVGSLRATSSRGLQVDNQLKCRGRLMTLEPLSLPSRRHTQQLEDRRLARPSEQPKLHWLVNRSTHFFSCARLHIHFDYSKPESRADLAHLKVDKGESKYCPLGPLLVHTHMLAQLAQRSAPQHALLEGWLIHSPILLCSVQVGDLALLNPRGGWGWHRPGFFATFARSSPSLDNLSGHVAGF